MAFAAFKELPEGSFFIWRGRFWFKISLTAPDNTKINAISDNESSDNEVDVELIDEATLVDTNTGLSEAKKKHYIAMLTKRSSNGQT